MGEAKIVSEKQIWLHLVHLIKNGLSSATETKVNNIFYSSVYFQSFYHLFSYLDIGNCLKEHLNLYGTTWACVLNFFVRVIWFRLLFILSFIYLFIYAFCLHNYTSIQGRIQGGGGGTFATPWQIQGGAFWDFEAKNVPNFINRMCFSISSFFYLMEVIRRLKL